MIGIIAGTSFYDKMPFSGFVLKKCSTKFGKAELFLGHISGKKACFAFRHGKKHNILPHEVNYAAIIEGMKRQGCMEIIGVCSAGSLKKAIKPGTIAVPSDFISFERVTSLKNEIRHITPEISTEISQKLLKAAIKAGINAKKGLVYAQSPGPRLETRAEVRFYSKIADIIGMTMAGESTICSELGVKYASLCSIDNYANGIEGKASYTAIKNAAKTNSSRLAKIILDYLEQD